MAKELSYDDLRKEVKSLENDISFLTGKINDCRRNLFQNETEANNLLINWRQACLQNSQVTNCVEEIEKINNKDKEEREKYEIFKKDKDKKQHELREKIIQLSEMTPDAQEKKIRLIFDINLKKSSLLKLEGEQKPKVLVELAEAPYPSLHHFIVAGKKTKGEERKVKIGFMMKLRFAKEICSVMAWLHGNDRLHLRLKPTNILFTKEWKIKVADYGLHLPQVYKIPDGWINSGHAYYYPPELLLDTAKVSKAVDVYSFGLVLYSLLVEEIPYYEAKSIEELLTSIEKKPVSLYLNSKKIYPLSIIDLLTKCLSKKVDERPTFEYLSNDTTWTKIYQDMVSVGLECGKVIWDRAAEESKLPTTTTSIPWDVFSKVLWRVLEINYEDTPKDKARQQEVEDCVKTMLYLKDGKVDLNNWYRFLRWFAPLTIGKDGKEFINRVVELLKAPWFYGREFNRTMSDGLINKILNDKKIMAENKGKYPFLVRIAESQQERFCFVYYAVGVKPPLIHFPISPDDFVDVGIYKYVNDMAKKKNWFPTKEERQYQRDIFDKIQKLESKDMNTKDKSIQISYST